MKSKSFIAAFCVFLGSQASFSQITPPPAPPPKVSSAPTLSETLTTNLEKLRQKSDVPREKREQAYGKLLEGQRYIWTLFNRTRTQAGIVENSRLAKQSLQKAVELDPTLAEGYTALAELSLTAPPQDLNEGILLANIAVKIDPDNFGGHQLLGRFYSIKSGIGGPELNSPSVRSAVSEWTQVIRLDPRNAEAYAFLSAFYEKTGKQSERLEALKNWLAAATPLDSRFYRAVFGKQAELSPETASLKLGEALIENGQIGEAVEILSRSVADNPDSTQTIELLRQAIEAADNNSVGTAVQALQQAVFANPDNVSLLILLAKVEARSGKIDEAAKVLQNEPSQFAEKDKVSAASLQVALGDIFVNASRFADAVTAYRNALTKLGAAKNELAADNEREFSRAVYEKLINAYKKGNRPDEAIETIRALRVENNFDESLLRLEAATLTESGKVDEAVSLMNNWANIPRNPVAEGSNSSKPAFDPAADAKFRNYIFVSDLYNRAKRGKEAIEAANQAYKIAQNNDRRQIAKLILATAQQSAGEYSAAETTLRELLKAAPENPIALNNLGYFLVERGENLDEALKLIQQAVKADPTSSSYLDSLGWAYFKLGKLDEAEKYLKDALRFDNSSVTINEHLGDVHQKQGKTELAKIAWQKALSFALNVQETNRLKAKLNMKLIN